MQSVLYCTPFHFFSGVMVTQWLSQVREHHLHSHVFHISLTSRLAALRPGCPLAQPRRTHSTWFPMACHNPLAPTRMVHQPPDLQPKPRAVIPLPEQHHTPAAQNTLPTDTHQAALAHTAEGAWSSPFSTVLRSCKTCIKAGLIQTFTSFTFHTNVIS